MAAPGGAGPIGPYPPGVESDEDKDAYDRLRRRVLWTFPSGLYVVGSKHADRSNLMTLNWCSQLSFEPKLIGIGVEHGAVTHELVSGGGAFTVCTIAREDRAIIRKFTKPVDPAEFGCHPGPVTGVPVLDQAAAFVECEVRQAVELGGHTLFVGEVVNAVFQQAEDTEVLRMEDTRMNYGG